MNFEMDQDTIVTSSTATTGEFFPGTPWYPVNPEEVSARGWLEVTVIAGTGTTLWPAIQLANNVLAPDAAQIIGVTGATAVGVTDPQAATTITNLTQRKWMRGGTSMKVTSGTGWARVGTRIQTWNP